jgi:ubiquinone/menaquinone biosynthesis C-methylase UbiE
VTEITTIDYNAWALRYDQTRGISPSVFGPLRASLGPGGDRMLLDIGGGTGNYSVALGAEGFRVFHCDPSPGMVRRARSKDEIPHAVVADGQALPFRDTSFDVAVAIKVLNHVSDRDAFVREAKRVTREGPVILLHATKEGIEGNWLSCYVPSLLELERFQPETATVEQLERAGFRTVEVSHIRYEDMDDGSAQALKRFPEALLDEERIMNTSLLSRLPEDTRREAFEAIKRDNASGRLQEVIAEYEPLSLKNGDGTLFVART